MIVIPDFKTLSNPEILELAKEHGVPATIQVEMELGSEYDSRTVSRFMEDVHEFLEYRKLSPNQAKIGIDQGYEGDNVRIKIFGDVPIDFDNKYEKNKLTDAILEKIKAKNRQEDYQREMYEKLKKQFEGK